MREVWLEFCTGLKLTPEPPPIQTRPDWARGCIFYYFICSQLYDDGQSTYLLIIPHVHLLCGCDIAIFSGDIRRITGMRPGTKVYTLFDSCDGGSRLSRCYEAWQHCLSVVNIHLQCVSAEDELVFCYRMSYVHPDSLEEPPLLQVFALFHPWLTTSSPGQCNTLSLFFPVDIVDLLATSKPSLKLHEKKRKPVEFRCHKEISGLLINVSWPAHRSEYCFNPPDKPWLVFTPEQTCFYFECWTD